MILTILRTQQPEFVRRTCQDSFSRNDHRQYQGSLYNIQGMFKPIFTRRLLCYYHSRLRHSQVDIEMNEKGSLNVISVFHRYSEFRDLFEILNKKYPKKLDKVPNCHCHTLSNPLATR